MTKSDDDMVLELAFAAGCLHIITRNVRDFRGSEQLGVTALSPERVTNEPVAQRLLTPVMRGPWKL